MNQGQEELSSDSSSSFRFRRRPTRKTRSGEDQAFPGDTGAWDTTGNVTSDEKKEEGNLNLGEHGRAVARRNGETLLQRRHWSTGGNVIAAAAASSGLDAQVPRTEQKDLKNEAYYVSLRELSSDIGCTPSPHGVESSIINGDERDSPRNSLHFEKSTDQEYFRVKFRGVVSLLQEPRSTATRSGYYLSYGEVFSRKRIDTGRAFNGGGTQTPSSSAISVRHDNTYETIQVQSESSFSSPTDRIEMIRVDRILTGGYAVDFNANLTNNETPFRESQVQIMHGPSPVPENVAGTSSCLGYMVASKGPQKLIEKLDSAPSIEQGKFRFRVISTSPVPILTGPSLDSPKTRAVLLPSSVHEVSLKFSVESHPGVTFLRLSYRRGWIADRQLARDGRESTNEYFSVVKEIANSIEDVNEDGETSIVSSVASSYLMTPTIGARRRHRPPRRKESSNDELDRSIPRDVVGGISVATHTPVKGSRTAFVGENNPTPSSNVSILTNDSFTETNISHLSAPVSPDISYSTNKSSTSHHGRSVEGPSWVYLMKVTAPAGLKILDAPQFQVNSLIHGRNPIPSGASSAAGSADGMAKGSSIFHTMTSRATTATVPGKSYLVNRTTRKRMLPRGALFEASHRMEKNAGYSEGEGLIKLADGSGWAIVPKKEDLDLQFQSLVSGSGAPLHSSALAAKNSSGYEEVGRALLNNDDSSRNPSEKYVRVHARNGVPVACPPPMPPLSDSDISPVSSKGSSAHFNSSNAGARSVAGESDVASSVGSGFLDALLRTPQKSKDTDASGPPVPHPHRDPRSTTLPCGACVRVETWDENDGSVEMPLYVRLVGGQGWVCTFRGGKEVAVHVHRPEVQFGSFWFRVQSSSGVKVRPGPSRRAPSIKSEDGALFRFECGEYLRASEVVTIFSGEGKPVESFAKLYRNRHVRLNEANREFRTLFSMTAPGEWVEIYGGNELFLEECAAEPRIERHREGWRYNVLPDIGVEIRKGPSFAAAKSGTTLLGGESVVINERVCPAGQKMTWLRIKDGDGWVHDIDESTGQQIMLAHALRHRTKSSSRKQDSGKSDDIAYNAIIARLFHNEALKKGYQSSRFSKK